MVDRFVATDPARLFDREALCRRVDVFRWVPTPEDLESWSAHDLEPLELIDGRVALRPTGSDPRVVLDVDLLATDVDVIEIALDGVRGDLALSWAGPRELFSRSRRLILSHDQGTGTNPRRYGFRVGDSPHWNGRIARLRIDPTGGAQASTELAGIRGVRLQAVPGRVDAARSSPAKATLGQVTRTALLTPPGTRHTHRTEVSGVELLRVAYGVEVGVPHPVRFVIGATAPGGAERVVFEDVLQPAHGEMGYWHLAVVELAGLAGEVELTLRTEAEAYDLGRGFPLWGNPEILDPTRTDDRPNVLVICLDTLRADRMSAYGHTRPTSPKIDAWAREEAVLFETAVAPAPWTLPSHTSLFTGWDALRHGVNHHRPVPGELTMLAELLYSGGWRTAAITGGGYLHPHFGFAQGFEMFDAWPEELSERELEDRTERAVAWLRWNRHQPFFLFVHTYEVHSPHRRREPYFSRLTADLNGELPDATVDMENHGWQGLLAPGDYFVARSGPDGEWHTPLTEPEVELVRAMYDSAVAYADAHVARILATLREVGIADRTLVVITSDHGEALGEDDRAGHAYLEEYNLRVPLIVRLPEGRGAGARIGSQVRLIDVAPTILEAVGIEPPLMDGRSLLPVVDGADHPGAAFAYAASSNRGLALRLDSGLKYTFNDAAWASVWGDERLVDLRSDPAESVDLSPDHPRTLGLRSAVQRALDRVHRGARLLIRNGDSSRILRGHLTGGWVAPARVKSADAGARCLTWNGDVRAEFRLAPGEEITLLFQSIAEPRVGARGALGEGPDAVPVRLDLDLGTLRHPVTYALTPRGFRRTGESETELVTGFRAWTRGTAQATASPLQVSPMMRDQLRALGYVEE